MAEWSNAKYDKQTEFTTPLPNEKFLFSLSKNIKILDAGCGYGRVLRYLDEMGFKNLTGFDISKDYIDEAKRICPEAKFFVSSFESFEPKDKYGLILLMGVIEYILSDKNQDIFFDKISKSLSNSGYVLLETFVVDFKAGWRQYITGFVNTMHFGRFRNSKGFECHHQTVISLKKILQKYFIIESEEAKRYLTWTNNACKGHSFILRPKN